MAAAIGAGLAIHEPVGNMVVDVGGGTSETAVISLGGVVASGPSAAAASTSTRRSRPTSVTVHGVAIGERTAEAIKLAIGSAHPTTTSRRPRSAAARSSTGMPKTVLLSPAEVRDAVEEHVAQIVDAAVTCLGDAPPELAQDIIFEGIHLVGGGALLRGMDQRLANGTAVPVHLVDPPLECVVLGAGRCLESLDELQLRSSPTPTDRRRPDRRSDVGRVVAPNSTAAA